MVERSRTRYAKSGDVHIANQLMGDGPIDLVFVEGFMTHLDVLWELPAYRHFCERLASFARVIRFDKRGMGLSDHVQAGTLEERMEDIHVLATLLFTDMVGSTRTAHELGDERWHHLLELHNTIVRRELAGFRGREHSTAGDGFFAWFDGPARAIRCARSIVGALKGELGIDIRAGLHTGECEQMGDDLGGVAVHTAARVGALAGPGEVLVSQTVCDLVSGSGIVFKDRGAHALKGVPGEWALFAVVR